MHLPQMRGSTGENAFVLNSTREEEEDVLFLKVYLEAMIIRSIMI